jgi:hypothetical protein
MQKKQPTPIRRDGGQVMLLIVLLLLAGSLAIMAGIMATVKSQVRVVNELVFSKSAYHTAEGVLEETVYRYMNNMSVLLNETATLGGVTITTVTEDVSGGISVTSTGNELSRVRSVQAILVEGHGASFNFGVQTDVGGIIMENSSSIDGNAFSNGTIVGHNKNRVKGTAISAGPDGLIEEVRTDADAYAHEISDSTIHGNAYFDILSGTVVIDGSTSTLPTIATSSLPIPDEVLDQWQAFAASSSVMTQACIDGGGTVTFDGNHNHYTLGPVKIPCNVRFRQNPTVTIAGVIWVEGNLEFDNGPKFLIHPDIGNRSVPLIVDNPANRTTSSMIDMSNSGLWTGNGNRSYIMLISRNESASNGGTVPAIRMTQTNGGSLLVYAGHGEILLRNLVKLTQITAHRVRLQQSAEIIYDTGLASALFTIGPGGGYTIDSWREVE